MRPGGSDTRPRARACAVVVLSLAFLPVGPATAATLPAPALRVTPDVITAYSSGGGCDGRTACYRVMGNTIPGAQVTIIVTDDVSTYSVTAIATAARYDDPGAEVRAGDFWVSPGVSNLGTHDRTLSTLTFTAVARAGGETSPPSVATALKRSATPGDEGAPFLQITAYPPRYWSPFANSTAPASTYVRQTGWTRVPISGKADDNAPENFGVASEIADIVVRVADDGTGEVVKEMHDFTRWGTQAGFGGGLDIRDFETLHTYVVTYKAIDAAGNEGDELTSRFTLLP